MRFLRISIEPAAIIQPRVLRKHHQLRHVPWMIGAVRALERAFAQVPLGEAAHRLAELLLLGGQVEIHGSTSPKNSDE